jgi:hypothetical protein
MNKTISFFCLLSLLGLLLLVNGCREDFPDPLEGEARFWLSADFVQGGKMEAGKADDELFPSHEIGDFGVGEYRASLRPLGCEDCPGQFRMILRDYRGEARGGSFDPDSAFPLGDLRFRGQEPANSDPATAKPQAFRFKAHSHSNGPFNYHWDFGDGHISHESEPIHTYESSGDYEVSLTLKDAGGCTDQTFQRVGVGEAYRPCGYDYTTELLGNGRVRFKVELDSAFVGGYFADFLWDFGYPGAFMMTSDTVVEFTYPADGIYPVTLIVFDGCPCPCPVTKNIYTEPAPSCASQVVYRKSPTDRELSTVTLEWIDENGTFYTTDIFEGQPPSSRFQLLEAAPELPAPNGQETYSLRARFDCVLYNPDDPQDSLLVRGAEARLAVGLAE